MEKETWLQYTKEERVGFLNETLTALHQQPALPDDASEIQKIKRQQTVRQLEKQIFNIFAWEKDQNE